MITYLLFAFFCTHMVQSADMNAMSMGSGFVSNVGQYVVPLYTMIMPVQNGSEQSILYQQFVPGYAYFQQIEVPQSNFPEPQVPEEAWESAAGVLAAVKQERDAALSQNDRNQGAIDRRLHAARIEQLCRPQQEFQGSLELIDDAALHERLQQLRESYRKATTTFTTYTTKSLCRGYTQAERARWRSLAEIKQKHVERIKHQIDLIEQKSSI